LSLKSNRKHRNQKQFRFKITLIFWWQFWWEMPRRDDSEDTDITDDESTKSVSKFSKKKNKKNFKQITKTHQPANPSIWFRFLRWCESSNNLGYLQGILFLNTVLIYGLHSWFQSQYGQDPLTFLSVRYLNVRPAEHFEEETNIQE